MIRSTDKNIILCYSPSIEESSNKASTASDCHAWVYSTARKHDWQNIYSKATDSTLALFPILWYILYAWADALRNIFLYLNDLERQVLDTANMALTQQLHTFRVTLMNYRSLLEDMKKTTLFLLTHLNPCCDLVTMQSNDGEIPGSPVPNIKEPERLKRECDFLDLEISRLQESLAARNERIKDVMAMVFSRVTIRDSTAMKQISYITMFFLPATFVAGVFGMNVSGMGTDSTSLRNYIETAVPLTLITVWFLVALQMESEPDESSLNRLWWPYILCRDLFRKFIGRRGEEEMSSSV